jgi:pimeloyl-ACP methyl ester carboxylesterase
MKASTKRPITPERLSFAHDQGVATLFRSTDDTDRAFVIATGFGAVPELYFELADELAHFGYHVLVPDIISPFGDEDPNQTITYKARRIVMALDALSHKTVLHGAEIVGHSFGGVCAVEAAAQLTQELVAIHLLSSLGFGGAINESGVVNVRQVPGFYLSEVLGATRHLNRFLGFSALKAELAVMANIPERLKEIQEMKTIPNNYMTNRLGHICSKEKVYVAPKDHIIDPKPTRLAYGAVVDIHSKATHFAPATHGAHVAHSLVA